jgi:uncharacterized protein YjbI with pentapeptide repeats
MCPIVQGPAIEPRRADGVPFIAEDNLLGMSFAWNLKHGKPSYALVVKATCDIALPKGPAELREEGNPPSGDEHVLDPPMSSLRYASDLAVVKARCDVMMWGHAYGRGRPSSETRFAFGDAGKKGHGFDRRMRVFGPRPWKGLRPGEAQPFEKVPLMWELADKHDELNPVGRTHDGPLAPQLEALDEKGPAGFGSIPMMWPVRLRWFGTYDMRWYKQRYPFFAEDFDPAAFQAAPRLQQLDHIRGDEPFVLEGMHPEHRVVSGTLPGLTARAYAVGPSPDGGIFQEVPLRLDTVFFDLEQMTISLVWRGSHAVSDEQASDVSAWFAHVYEEEPSEEEMRVSFWRRFDPEFAAMLDGEEPEEPPPAPAPVAWLPADQDPARSVVEAWLAGGDPPARDTLAGAELSGLDFSGRDMKGWVLRGAHLERCRFIETDLTEAELGDVVAPEAMFDRAILDRADLVGAHLEKSIFSGASLVEADLTDCEADGCQFDGVTANAAVFEAGSFEKATFAAAMLDDAGFSEANLIEANFSKASMKGARLYDANASRANFEHANLTEARADGVSLANAVCDGATAKNAVFDEADLTEVCWRKASLPAVSLTKAVALRARFIAVDMRGALMSKATLVGADFRTSDLMEADLAQCDLTDANMSGANLFGAELFKAKLGGLKTEGALIGRTILEGL